MKNYLMVYVFLTATPAIAFSDVTENEIMSLDKPYTITHLDNFDVDCVWTRDEQGRLQSEATGPDGPGVCWDVKSVDQVVRLDKEKKLVWHNQPKFDYEYGNKNKCYYRVDKKGGFVDVELGDSITESEADECKNENSKEKALSLATRIEKEVRFGGYIATKNNILGSVSLACYTGSIDSNDKWVSKEERTKRYNALLSLYENDNLNMKRIREAFTFARNNLSDRYPLDTRGQYRVRICDQMVLKGKL